jgi:hypothetical protein
MLATADDALGVAVLYEGFLDKHGCPRVDGQRRGPDGCSVLVPQFEWSVRHQQWERTRTWLLPDGARVANDGMAPVLYDPPSRERDRLQAQRSYHSEKLARVQRDVKALDIAMRGYGDGHVWDAEFYGPAGRDGSKDLARLRAIANEERLAVARLTVRLARLARQATTNGETTP